jgi:hypothetical protein
LAAHVNFAAVIEWLALVLIFYPRKGFVGTGAGGTSFNTNMESIGANSSQISNPYSAKLVNVPPGSGAGYNNNNFSIKQSAVGIDNNNDYQSNIKSTQPLKQPGPELNNNDNNNNNNIDDYNNNNYNNSNNNINNNNNEMEDSQRKSEQKQSSSSSLKKFKMKTPSPTVLPLTDSNSDIGSYSNYSDEGSSNNKSVSNLKRNISISKDGRMLYGETKPLGKVKGAEFIAVEKADPSFIPSYYFTNDFKDKDGNILRVPKFGNEDSEGENNSNKSNTSSVQQDITRGVVQQEIIVPQQSTMKDNNGGEDDDDGFFYAM